MQLNRAETPPILLTVKQLSMRHPAFTEIAIRNLIYAAKPRQTKEGTTQPNGFESVIIRVGRKILLDEKKFIEWVYAQNEKAA